MKKQVWIKSGIAVVLFILLGVLRDFIFINWNYQLNATLNNQSFTYAHSFFTFLTPWSFNQLYWSKWLLTAIFCLANFLIGYFYFSSTIIRKQLLLIYITVGTFGLIIFGLSYLDFNKAYTLSREIIGFLQSPLPTVLLYFIHQLTLEKSK
jgi:hypothetical protein